MRAISSAGREDALNQIILNRTVSAFNHRDFAGAARQAAEGLATATGADEAFWMGLGEACEGMLFLMENQLTRAEHKLIMALRTLRNFGFRYENFEVTSTLAGVRRVVEEIRLVRSNRGKVFDMTLLPRMKMAAIADD
ncbi:hypothetical protein COW53_04165 [bacterium CG17_big_fil_post_rev_8_21_14_2_50_64_8]|nr:MAG: hypothetical protein COW53_04165 [bacterium CG17_big_fil_post_rev_8_21_14_2_50_64_8]